MITRAVLRRGRALWDGAVGVVRNLPWMVTRFLLGLVYYPSLIVIVPLRSWVLPAGNHVYTNLMWYTKMAVLLVVFLWCSAAFALISYLALYWFIVPSAIATYPVYFNFSAPQPETVIDLSERSIYNKQSYDLTIHMVMPESPANVNLGMFMVSLDIQDHRGASVLHSARPSRIKYRTEPIRFLESMVQAIPIILGYMDQAQTLVIPLMEKAIEQDSHPFYKVTLQLSKPQIEVYSAELILTANLHGLAYFLYHYCYTTAIIIICAIFWTLFVFFLIAWIIILIDTWPATYAPFAGTGFALGGAGGGSGTGTGIGTTGTGTGTGTGIGDAFSYRRRDSEHHTHHIDESGNPPSSLRRRRRRVASAAHPSFSESAGGDISSTNSSSEEDDIPHTPTALYKRPLFRDPTAPATPKGGSLSTTKPDVHTAPHPPHSKEDSKESTTPTKEPESHPSPTTAPLTTSTPTPTPTPTTSTTATTTPSEPESPPSSEVPSSSGATKST